MGGGWSDTETVRPTSWYVTAWQARNDRALGPLTLSAKYGHVKVVRLLRTARAAIEERDYQGNTPLMHACHEVRRGGVVPAAGHRTF